MALFVVSKEREIERKKKFIDYNEFEKTLLHYMSHHTSYGWHRRHHDGSVRYRLRGANVHTTCQSKYINDNLLFKFEISYGLTHFTCCRFFFFVFCSRRRQKTTKTSARSFPIVNFAFVYSLYRTIHTPHISWEMNDVRAVLFFFRLLCDWKEDDHVNTYVMRERCRWQMEKEINTSLYHSHTCHVLDCGRDMRRACPICHRWWHD